PAQNPQVLKRSSERNNHRERDDPRTPHRTPPVRSGKHKKQRVARQQQNHRQVIAESKRVRDEEQDEPAVGWPPRPLEKKQQRQRREQDVERIDFGDDRLAPERVRGGEQEAGASRGEHRRRQFGGDEYDDPAGQRPFDG